MGDGIYFHDESGQSSSGRRSQVELDWGNGNTTRFELSRRVYRNAS